MPYTVSIEPLGSAWVWTAPLKQSGQDMLIRGGVSLVLSKIRVAKLGIVKGRDSQLDVCQKLERVKVRCKVNKSAVGAVWVAPRIGGVEVETVGCSTVACER